MIIQYLGGAAIIYAMLAGLIRAQLKISAIYVAIMFTGLYFIAVGTGLTYPAAWQQWVVVTFQALWVALLALFCFSLPAHAELKKWVDKAGQVHYGDKIPPQYLRKEHQIMNKEGVVVESIPAAKTEAELREEKRQQRLAKMWMNLLISSQQQFVTT